MAVIICTLDQLTKFQVSNLGHTDSYERLFYLNHIKNTGATMGMFQKGGIILII